MAKRWYIVHAYSNFEKKVAESIREQAQARGLADLFDEILVPTEKVMEVRKGKKVEAERKFFPGYVLVKCELTDDAYHLIKNTPKVTGFLGADKKPMPISDSEAERIKGQVAEGIAFGGGEHGGDAAAVFDSQRRPSRRRYQQGHEDAGGKGEDDQERRGHSNQEEIENAKRERGRATYNRTV